MCIQESEVSSVVLNLSVRLQNLMTYEGSVRIKLNYKISRKVREIACLW